MDATQAVKELIEEAPKYIPYHAGAPVHLFAQPYNRWRSLCGVEILSGGGTIEVYKYKRDKYCGDCVERKERGQIL